MLHRAHAILAHVDPGYVEAGLGEHHRQGQARVAETDDANRGLARIYAIVERLS